jgi:uncharacterized surface protein with fasciclin (FAS1) repeats
MNTLKFLLVPGLFLFCIHSFGQARFKKSTDSAFKAIKAEELHKLENIERLVEATRSYENLDPQKKYTILAPNNKAFKRLSAKTIEYLLSPEHSNDLSDLQSHHTIEGRFTEKQIIALITKGEGKAYFTTISGLSLMAYLDKEQTIIFVDQNNRKIRMAEANYGKGDNIVHIVDGVILPYSSVY